MTKRFTLQAPEAYSGRLRAVALGLAVLRHAKVDTFEELEVALAARDDKVVKAFALLDLTDDQRDLLNEHRALVRTLTIKPLGTVAECSDCRRWMLVRDRTPTTCNLTLGCRGTPVRAVAALRVASEAGK